MKSFPVLFPSLLLLCVPSALAQPLLLGRTDGLAASGPDTSINSRPADPSNQANTAVSFSISDNDGFTGYECSVDSGTTFKRCFTPYRFSSLAEGQYNFCVRSVDGNSVKDSTPACFTWTVDLTAPGVAITEPTAGAGVFTKNPTLKGTTTEPSCEVHIFVGKTDVGTTTADASGQWTFTSKDSLNLANGKQDLSATAMDRAGNTSNPVTLSVNVSTNPPTTAIDQHPNPVECSSDAVFAFSSPSGATQFECQLDGATTFTACNDAVRFKGLSDSAHILYVRARDSAGNVGPNPQSYSWTVKAQAGASACATTTPTDEETKHGCSSSGGAPVLALSLLGGAWLLSSVRRRRSA